MSSPFLFLSGRWPGFLLGAAVLVSAGCGRKPPPLPAVAAPPSAAEPALASAPPASVPVSVPPPQAVPPPSAAEAYALFPKGEPRIAPTASDSRELALADPPGVCEFVVEGPSGVVRVRGVALSADGKFLTLASSFSSPHAVSVPGLPPRAFPSGWLARSGPWLIVPLAGNYNCRPVPTAAPGRLDLGGPFLVLEPRADARGRAVTASPAPPPAGAGGPDAAFQWISVPADGLLPGTPVLTSQKLLLGLVDEIRPEQGLARVARVTVPLPALAEAAGRDVPVPWGQEPPAPPLPFADPAVPEAAALADGTDGRKGKELAAACDALLRAHGAAPAAWYAAARGYARAGKPDQALASARMLAQLAPKEAEAWLLYGRQLAASGKFAEAVDAYQTASDRGALFHDVGLPVAVCLFRLGNTEAALDEIRTVLDKEPEGYDIWMAAGNMNRAAGKIAAAVDAYLAAVRLNPEAAEAWSGLADCYAAVPAWPAAAEAYTQLTLLDPGNAAAWYNDGVALLHAGKAAEAGEAFGQAVALSPSDLRARMQLARCEAAAGNLSGALRESRRVVEADAGFGPGWQQLGLFQLQAGDAKEAEAAWSRALQIDPSDVTSLRNLAQLRYEREGMAAAAPLLQRIEKVSPAEAAALRASWKAAPAASGPGPG